MHFASIVAASSLLAASVNAWTSSPTNGTDRLAKEGLVKLEAYHKSLNTSSSCNLGNAAVRKEWLTLCGEEKLAYISAVKCLMSKPSISGDAIPGAKSRYDDFVGVHINQTLSIHGTGNFLSWHRYFTWTYEHALREECGYDGYQPYINWGKYAHDIVGSPLFDGSETSISGDGEFIPHQGFGIPSNDAPEFVIPPGNGSGCVTTGPFKNMTVRLGPVTPSLYNLTANPRADGLGFNPRCLRRDLSNIGARRASTEDISHELISNRTDIRSFQDRMQGDFPNKYFGVHAGGHFWVGGDPGGDLYASPGDPYFFLHHAQIDRTWWIWQNQDPENRMNAIAGTNTIFNFPPSANTTLDDTIDLGVLAPAIRIGSVMSTLKEQFCYTYA